MSDPSSTAKADLRVAVLGTGTMGAAIARSLLRSGFEVSVWNRSPEKVKPLSDAGARTASDPSDAVRDADVVLTMLFDADAVLSVATEFLPNVRKNTIWMQSSTIGAQGMQAVAAAASSNHVPVVDAPVLGTKDPAEHAALTVLASGEERAVSALRPVFDAIGSKTIVVGDRLGAASDLKLVCNTWIGSLTAGTALSLALAHRFGLEPTLFLDAIAGSASDSPYAHTKGATIIDDERTPQFALDGLLKDLRLAQATAGSSSSPMYLNALERLYSSASDAGHGDEDVAWVYDVIES
ncbi:NAD(P)-dependent oxidoreductase [Humibacter sp. RRB41]|uniref:NAD(P)-dependent oxidoreductase n=1 Tax=Humibacter sp. RRB41 TaxID=2919946 RepID=UPI001FAABC5A|nr:NAD(P)-dependent oxidoreductase [Humibacter sp. RRB41]